MDARHSPFVKPTGCTPPRLTPNGTSGLGVTTMCQPGFIDSNKSPTLEKDLFTGEWCVSGGGRFLGNVCIF